MARQVKRAFRYRFHPTDGQAAELSRVFGCVRLVCNKALKERTRAWYGEQRRISYVQSSAALTQWKKTRELAFLTEVSSVPLQQALRHLQAAFGPLDICWFVSLLCEDTVTPAPATTNAVGLDAGITFLVTLSTGEKIANPKHERRDRTRPAKAQRELSRKAKGSANREKPRRRVAKVHARIADRRRDFLHKLSTRLVRENQTAVIDRWFPSSKLCGACGAVHDRDVNAARNILAAGLAASACGDGVRPQRESSRTGRSSVKQEPRRATAGISRP
ncbi:RNA-guided endonuclease InsQ/TnpB family protein [Streptomyces sp. 4F14]|uniref:RNA-guided endonuclease InsQ/TnpB family protein n=1 Tax=Streptomyces sp. 4F14 TaxID=3394380 RepID=UPI003A87EC0F